MSLPLPSWADERSSPGQVLGLLALAGIAGLAALYSLSGKYGPVSVLIILLSLFLITPILTSRRFDLMQPLGFVILLFFGYLAGATYAVLVSAELIDPGESPLPSSRSVATIATRFVRFGLMDIKNADVSWVVCVALGYVILGFFAFLFGYRNQRAARRIAAWLPRVGGGCDSARLYFVIALYSAIGFGAFLYRMSVRGGVADAVESLYLYSQRVTSGYVTMLILLFPLATVLWSYSGVAKRFRLAFWGHFAAGSLMLVTTGVRNSLVMFWLLLLVGFWYRAPKRPRLALLAGTGALALLVMFGIAGYRTATRTAAFTQQALAPLLAEEFRPARMVGYFLGSRDFTDISAFVEILQAMPRDMGFRYGATFVNAVLLPVPREVWADKPYPLSTELGLLFTGELTGRTPSIVAELYVNFSWPGIIIGMFLLGILCRGWYAFLLHNLTNRWALLLYALFVVTFLANLVRIDFAMALTGYGVYSLPVLCALFFIAKREQPVPHGEFAPGGLRHFRPPPAAFSHKK